MKMYALRGVAEAFLMLALSFIGLNFVTEKAQAYGCSSCYYWYTTCWQNCSSSGGQQSCFDNCSAMYNDCMCRECKDPLFCWPGGGS